MIKCKSCIPGQTFSDEYGPSFCKPCDVCHPKEKVLSNCTISQNAKCSKSCKDGYYFDNITTHECQECSYCCNDKNKDYIIEECREMPKEKQCSIQSDCSPPINTAKTLITTSYMITTPQFKDKMIKKEIIIGATIGGVMLLIIIILYILWRFRRTSETPADEESQPLRCQTCLNLEKSYLNLQLDVKPGYEVQEGQGFTITCSVEKQLKLETLENLEIKWIKDGVLLTEFENSPLLWNPKMDIFDFGSYKCQIKCKYHAESSIGKCEKEVFIDVRPGEGKCYQKIRNIIGSKIEEEEFIVRIVPFWNEIAKTFGLEDYRITALEACGPYKAAQDTLNYLYSSTDTTVYELLKFSKENDLTDFVKFLSHEISFILTEKAKETQDASGKKTNEIGITSNLKEQENSESVDKVKKRPSVNRSVSYESSI
ncbi:hypothetical protein AC249_AIPGENE22993 [Exaiptasia diaphana]|nr:hypothetical protein AC249_AIPGENE22993 [Exaiptasia diaphana]